MKLEVAKKVMGESRGISILLSMGRMEVERLEQQLTMLHIERSHYEHPINRDSKTERDAMLLMSNRDFIRTLHAVSHIRAAIAAIEAVQKTAGEVEESQSP